MGYDVVGAYMWVFIPGGTGGGSWSYLSKAASSSALGNQVSNTSCGKYIWTTDGWIFNPKGASTSKYVNGRYYYIQGPDGTVHQFGAVPPPPIAYDPQTRTFNHYGTSPATLPDTPECVEIAGRVVYCSNGLIYSHR